MLPVATSVHILWVDSVIRTHISADKAQGAAKRRTYRRGEEANENTAAKVVALYTNAPSDHAKPENAGSTRRA